MRHIPIIRNVKATRQCSRLNNVRNLVKRPKNRCSCVKKYMCGNMYVYTHYIYIYIYQCHFRNFSHELSKFSGCRYIILYHTNKLSWIVKMIFRYSVVWGRARRRLCPAPQRGSDAFLGPVAASLSAPFSTTRRAGRSRKRATTWHFRTQRPQDLTKWDEEVKCLMWILNRASIGSKVPLKVTA